ncbi:MAG: thioredoxin [Candidatus Methanoperedens sp.]
MIDETDIKNILKNYKVVAIVGVSREKIKYSYIVAEYLKNIGYRIIPINPFAEEILGEKCYKSLLEMPEKLQKEVEIIDIFRPSDEVMPIVDEAVELKKKHDNLEVIWMQLGIINEEAADKAIAAGLNVVMNKCMMIEHGRLIEKENKEFEQIEKKQTALLQGGVVSGPIQLNDSNFDENVNKSDIVIVDFWAPWCGPCRAISPVIEELSKEYAGKVTFAKLKVDDNPLTAGRFGVTSIPTILFLKKGREIDRIIELITRNLIKNKIEEHIR